MNTHDKYDLPPMWLWGFVSGASAAVAFLRWLGAI